MNSLTLFYAYKNRLLKCKTVHTLINSVAQLNLNQFGGVEGQIVTKFITLINSISNLRDLIVIEIYENRII